MIKTEIMRYLGSKPNDLFIDMEGELEGYLSAKGFSAESIADNINKIYNTLCECKNPNYKNATSLADIPIVMSWEICDICAILEFGHPYTTMEYELTECINKLKLN